MSRTLKERCAALAASARELLRGRPFLAALPGMGWNLTYALLNGAFALAFSSWWSLTLCALYLLLGLMKLSVVTLPRSARRTERGMLRFCAAASFGLAVAACGLTVLTIHEGHNPERNMIVMIANAAYTFTFAGLAIRSMALAAKRKSPPLIALRNTSCAGALLSVLSLQRSMLGTFGDASDRFTPVMQACTGGVAFLLLIAMGVGMLVLSRRAPAGRAEEGSRGRGKAGTE